MSWAKNRDDQSPLSRSQVCRRQGVASEFQLPWATQSQRKMAFIPLQIFPSTNLSTWIKDHNEMLSARTTPISFPGYRAEPQECPAFKRLQSAAAYYGLFWRRCTYTRGPSEVFTLRTSSTMAGRSRSRNRSRMKDPDLVSSVKPHLPVVTHKNIHQDEPSKYELPSDWEANVEEEENTDGR